MSAEGCAGLRVPAALARLDPGWGSCASAPPGSSQAGCRCHCAPLNAGPLGHCVRSSSACLAACRLFAATSAVVIYWFSWGLCSAEQTDLVPSRVCSKHLGASSKKQPQPCSAWAAPGQGRAKPFLQRRVENTDVSLISQLAIDLLM